MGYKTVVGRVYLLFVLPLGTPLEVRQIHFRIFFGGSYWETQSGFLSNKPETAAVGCFFRKRRALSNAKLPQIPFFLHISWGARSAREIDEERSRLCDRVQDDTESLFAFDWKSS